MDPTLAPRDPVADPAPPNPGPAAPTLAPRVGDIVLFCEYGLHPAMVLQAHDELDPESPLDLFVFSPRYRAPALFERVACGMLPVCWRHRP